MFATMRCLACTLSLLAAPVLAATLTAGDLKLTLDGRNRVTSFAVGKQNVLSAPTALASLCDVTKAPQFVPGRVTGGDLATGLRLDFGAAQAEAVLRVRQSPRALHFACELQGAELPARGMLLRFAFPVKARGWRWHDDMQTAREIDDHSFYENVRGLRAWADMPEWADQPALRMGYSNRNFATVLTGPVGVCLAVPLDQPRIFRTAYDAAAQQLQIIFDFALCAETRPPRQASFAFDLYSCDPSWGFRSALQRYYALYPEMFRNYIEEPGQWMAFSRLSGIDNANEFYFGLQEGAPEPEYDDKIGVLSTTYFTHAGMGANLPPPYDPEKDPLPPYEEQVKAMEAAFKRRTGMDNVFHQVGLFNVQGRLDVRKWRVYAHLIAQFNLDPELPYGAWYLKRAPQQIKSIKQRTGGDLDGFYYDGLTAGINYRPDHFKYSEAPPLWDPKAKKPLLNNFFSSCEFSRAAAELLRPQGKITMMNGALGASFYIAPWLDVFGAETGLRISRENFNYIRTVTYHKPFLTLLKGNYEQKIGHAEMELFMKRCLAYGVFPGFFDWPPSGLGPGGRYWDHPEYYERDRDLFRKYQPLCRTLALAGWEPVTYARSSETSVFIERFGPTPEGVLWFTLLNEASEPRSTKLTFDARALKLDPQATRAMDVLTGAAVPLSAGGNGMSAEVEVPAEGVMALQLAVPNAAAAWRLEQAVETVARGARMREVDREKPPIAVQWRPRGRTYEREQHGDRNLLVFAGDGKSAQSCSQWAMLFQQRPAPVTLRVRASGENLSGRAQENLGVRCRIAWVTPSYSHYEWRFFDLPEGTYEARDFEFRIESEHPLRAIYVEPKIGAKVKGKLRLASITLADAQHDDYVVDPSFSEWYEPVPQDMQDRLASETEGLRQSLEEARSLAARGDPQTRQALFDCFGKCSAVREWIHKRKAENGCRRALRDLETVERHLGFAAMSALKVPPLKVSGPSQGAPGDVVRLSFAAPRVSGLDVRTELRGPEGVAVKPTADGAAVTLPPTAEPGTTVEITGLAHLGPPGRAATIRVTHQVQIVAPLELSVASQGFSAEQAQCRLSVMLHNNRVRPSVAQLAVHAPEGWQVKAPAELRIPASDGAQGEIVLTGTTQASAGPVEVAVRAKAAQDTAQARITLLYIPPKANLLRNPGFEQDKKAWGFTEGAPEIDTSVAHSGQASARLTNKNAGGRSGVSQSVTLNQKTPTPILVRACSKGEKVSGARDRGYSLYVDIYYMDGTPLYGQTFDFETGSTDWQLGELYIEPAKPIRNVNVYLLLRGKSGTAWFDDIAVMEDPRRRGNIAREAQASVDSSYSGYDATPVNDGIVRAEGLHWTKEAWASAEDQKEHWIELKFDRPRQVARATIYWSLDAGIPRTSREVRLQAWQQGKWATIATAKPAEPVPQTTMRLTKPVTAVRFRLLQPKGAGPEGRPHLMWVREVELFGAS